MKQCTAQSCQGGVFADNFGVIFLISSTYMNFTFIEKKELQTAKTGKYG